MICSTAGINDRHLRAPTRKEWTCSVKTIALSDLIFNPNIAKNTMLSSIHLGQASYRCKINHLIEATRHPGSLLGRSLLLSRLLDLSPRVWHGLFLVRRLQF